jgi:hypothetical protein
MRCIRVAVITHRHRRGITEDDRAEFLPVDLDVATAGAVEDDAPPELRRDLLRRPAPRLVHGVGQLVGILATDMIAADEREREKRN